MNVLELTERIRLESPNYVPDDCGGAEQSWQAIDTCFAKVHFESSAASVSVGGQRDMEPRYRVIMRAPRTLSADMRIVWREKMLAIDTIRPGEDYVHVQCREVRA